MRYYAYAIFNRSCNEETVAALDKLLAVEGSLTNERFDQSLVWQLGGADHWQVTVVVVGEYCYLLQQ